MTKQKLTQSYISQRGYYSKWKNAQQFFENNFIDKSITYTYGSYKNQTHEMCICMHKYHFIHLLGLKYGVLGAKTFWRDLKNNKINWNELDFCYYEGKSNRQPETFENKMAIIDYLPEILTSNARVAPGGKYMNLSVDALLRLHKPCLALGVANPFSEGYFNTTLNIRSQVSNKGGNNKKIQEVYRIVSSQNNNDTVIMDVFDKKCNRKE
ncbi:PBECR4 domain-containing protein [Leuconostoc gelidum]|uniref:PBECR4 domain-containing protein n=1 Tax=Leuconostoc gelidum TaxID=1244 RepID=UPI000219213F|nr:PBECR4 domain-containing protein [Leuconostoc gelidum]GMA66761.1 hypothetical protein GCM10025884_03880 [Leuconostoc gelidum subsp. gelidum]